ncbi:MAG: secretin N-terminal domain-containing protein [Phycisphaerae bacterium]
MERSKLIISIVVGIAAVLIIWRVGIYPPVPEQTEKPAETKVVTEAEKPPDVQKPGDANEPEVASDVSEPGELADVNEPRIVATAGESGRPDSVGGQIRPAVIIEPGESVEPNEPMEIVNLKNVEMKTIIEKLAKWTGKVIIPTDESMKQKITIYAPEKLPRSKAIAKIYSALRLKGYIAEQTDGTIFLKPITEAKLGEVPTISEDYPLAMVENKDQVVQKFFKLKNYSPQQMGQIIQPLIGDYGYVGADESTGSLLVIDTVKSLMRIDLIIKQFDVVEVEEIITEIFEIRHGNPTEIVELLQTLLGDGSSSSVRGPGGPGRGRGPFSMQRPDSGSSGGRGRTSGGTATSVTVGTSRTPAILIAEPTYNWIIVKATAQDVKRIAEWIEKLDRAVPTLFVDQPLSRIENKNQVVQKFFKLENYSPSQMSQIVGPLISETGYVSADETTGNLVVIDTVENLMRIEMIIAQFDVPEAEQTVTEIFEIHYSDPSEIVQLLRMLITGEAGTSSRSLGRSSYGQSSYGRSSYSRTSYSSSRGYTSSRGSSRPGSSSSVMIGPSEQPVVLIPEPTRRWIIARASAEDMKRIGEWIDKLDKEEPVKSEHETVSITYADVSEVASRLNEALQQMPGSELQASVLIQPLENARQIVIFGRADMREMVKKLIAEIDIPAGLFQTEHFKLKYADPDDVKEKIEELYSATTPGSGSRYTSIYYFGSSRSSAMSAETVRVISYGTRKQVTVIASAENMEKVRQQIKEWDVPIPVDELKPRIITLQNSDPVQMAELLKTLFTEEGGGGMSIFDILFGSGAEGKQKIIGPLYGQLTFEEVPGTKKIIVISKIPEAYDVIEQLVLDLDREEMGEVPKVLQLKYADPEDLSERLNAMFVEAGQTARIRLTAQGLSTASEMSDSSTTQSNQSNQGSSSSQSDSSTYTPPWSGSGARSSIDEELPISNVIGRIRFVPEPHTKSIMTLAPPEFIDEIEALIAQLDVPGKQVMIEAIIVEIEHSKVTSLGVQLATNPAAFGSLSENAITALGNLTHIGTHGSVTGIISPSGVGGNQLFGARDSGTVLGVGTDIYALIDFLVKTTDAKILNQQTLWTKDNKEASFFKGSEVAFLGSVTQAVNVGTQQSITFEKVGMELRARPSITPEDKVDMVVNVNISSLTTDLVNNQPVRSKMNTTTNMIVENKQTLLLGGILFQKDSQVERKLPGFGDLPLVGGLFRHNQVTQTNSELLVFMTPHVIDESAKEFPEAITEKKEILENTKEQLEAVLEVIG